ncbi:hypothetical protein IAR55_006951 [Kwoniella newhampshirensis]|uniref:Stc1 domain-containing protein n=1 Tax=Kwoniella newhampshirensis TaxID=1651941 RepID=A0AAW0YT06_9TREE
MQQQNTQQGDHQHGTDNQAQRPAMDLASTFAFPMQMEQQRPAGVPVSLEQRAMTPEEVERHQRSANGPTSDDPWTRAMRGSFPVPGARPANFKLGQVPVPDELNYTTPNETRRRERQQHQDQFEQTPHTSFRQSPSPSSPSQQSTSTHHQRSHVPSSASSASTHPIAMPMSTQRDISADPINAFLAEMPTNTDDPTKNALWTEMIRLKTRSLELQIAEARRKEKEAELELMRLKTGAAVRSDPTELSANNQDLGNGTGHGIGNGTAVSGSSGRHRTDEVGRRDSGNAPGPSSTPGTGGNGHNFGFGHGLGPGHTLPQNTAQGEIHIQAPVNTTAPTTVDPFSYNHPHDMAGPSNPQFDHLQNFFGGGQTAMSPFDLEAMLQSDNMNTLLSWLPDLGDGSSLDSNSMPLASTDYATANRNPTLPMSYSSVDPSTGLPRGVKPELMTTGLPPQSSPTRRRSPSPNESVSSQQQPPTKKAKRAAEKKIVVEQNGNCLKCSTPLAKVMIRAPKSQLPDPILVNLRCSNCVPVSQPSTLPDQNVAGTSIGTVETRKRMRASMEIDDEEAKVKDRRCWCDVCQRIIGSGQILGGKERESIAYMAEIICTSCESKYQRCTDCGGGGGPRVGIGKWRMKQVFHPGRKTCSLSHTRLGDRTRELGVHVTPTDFTPEQLKEVLTRCKALWNEKTLSRLAVPEMLEVDLPPHLSNPLRDYADVDDMVTRNWPSREAMIRADELDPKRFRRLLSLIWAHSKPRRSVRTVDLEEEWTKQAEENDDSDLSTVLANVKRTNMVIPAGSELIGMWGGEWDMQNGSLLISTFIPFEGTDGEDSTALSVGEMITKVQSLQHGINAERKAKADREGVEPDLLPPCQHLWSVSGGYIPLVRERFADILIRKRAFVHVEEYLTRHPEFIECIKARPVGLHPDIHRPLPQVMQEEDDKNAGQAPRPLILVRWLGNDFNAQKILEIKQMEFGGGKVKLKKRPRGKT